MFVLIGEQRLGKTMLFNAMRGLVGETNFTEVGPDDFAGPYNASIIDKLMVVCNELADNNKAIFYEKMKAVLTDSTIMRTQKYDKSTSVRVIGHYFATTNHEVAVSIPGENEGRFYFAKCLPREPKSREYYDEFYAWLTANPGSLLNYLQNIDISAYTPEHRPATTETKKQIAGQSRPAHEREYLNALTKGIPPLERDIHELHDLCQRLAIHGCLRKATDKQTARDMITKLGGFISQAVMRGSSSEVAVIRRADQYKDLNPEALGELLIKGKNQRLYTIDGGRSIV